jgi:hypothetical protein
MASSSERSAVHRRRSLKDVHRGRDLERGSQDPKPWVWHKTAEEILEPLARCCSAGIDNMSASS